MPYPIANYYLYVSFDVNPGKQSMPSLLLQVSVRELHNSMVIHPEEGGLKEERDEGNNVIISD